MCVTVLSPSFLLLFPIKSFSLWLKLIFKWDFAVEGNCSQSATSQRLDVYPECFLCWLWFVWSDEIETVWRDKHNSLASMCDTWTQFTWFIFSALSSLIEPFSAVNKQINRTAWLFKENCFDVHLHQRFPAGQ